MPLAPGLQGLFRPGHGHDALGDEGLFRHVHDLAQLLHGLAAGGGRHVLQEGQAGGVDVHGDGKGIGGLHQIHLLADGVQVPGLDGGHAAAAVFGDGSGGTLHDGGIRAVAGEGGDAGLGAGGHQDVIVDLVAVLVAIVERQGAHRGGKDRQVHRPAEQGEGGVHRLVGTDGVHVDAQLLPLLIVADEAGADALGTGAGNAVFAGQAVAHGTGFAVGAHCAPGLFQNFLISHDISPPNVFPKAAVCRGRWFDCTPVGRKRQPLAENFSPWRGSAKKFLDSCSAGGDLPSIWAEGPDLEEGP